MSRRNKLTEEERIAAVQEYLNGEGSYSSIARKYGIDRKLLRMWIGYNKLDRKHLAMI